MPTANFLRRLICLPPLEPQTTPDHRARAPGQAAPLAPVAQPHTLRQALYPIVLLYTAAFLGLELREFLYQTTPRYFSPEMYTGLLAAFAGERELRRWTGKPDRYALSAEFVIYAWWLSYLAILLWINLRPGCTRHMPADYPAICKQIIIIFFGAGTSKLFYGKKEDAREVLAHTDARQAITEYAASHGRITVEQCAVLLGVTDRHARRLMAQFCAEGLLEPEGDKALHTYRLTQKAA